LVFLKIINNSYCVVGDFTSASMVYVTVNGFPSNVSNPNALPANANEPALMGYWANFFIKEIATFLLPNGEFKGSPCVWSGIWERVYPCNTTTSTG
jgi:hypothetical protein